MCFMVISLYVIVKEKLRCVGNWTLGAGEDLQQGIIHFWGIKMKSIRNLLRKETN